jgi:hypothetical protein
MQCRCGIDGIGRSMTNPPRMEIIEIIIFINRTINGINIESFSISIIFMNV